MNYNDKNIQIHISSLKTFKKLALTHDCEYGPGLRLCT